MYLALGHLILFFCVCVDYNLYSGEVTLTIYICYFLYHGDSINVFEKAVFLSVNAKSDVIKWQPGASPIIQKLLCCYDDGLQCQCQRAGEDIEIKVIKVLFFVCKMYFSSHSSLGNDQNHL